MIIREYSFCRNSDNSWEKNELHFDKNYIKTIIRQEYAYKVTFCFVFLLLLTPCLRAGDREEGSEARETDQPQTTPSTRVGEAATPEST